MSTQPESPEVLRRRRRNERIFTAWEQTEGGGRRYWYDVSGRAGWRARYVKEVDALERTTSFRQEIYDAEGRLREVHQKHPVDTGHMRVGNGEVS